LDDGRALTAFVVGRFGDGDDVRVLAQKVSQGAAEHAHTDAMHDADARQSGEEGTFDEALDLGFSFVGGAADDVDLGAEHVVAAGAGGERDAPSQPSKLGRDPAAATADAFGGWLVHGCDPSDVRARHAGFYCAEADLE